MNTDFTNSLPKWLKFIQRYRASLIIGIPISSLTIGLVIVAIFQYQSDEAKDRVRHTYIVRNQAQELMVQVLTAEMAVKDYALTRQVNYLNSYQEASKRILFSIKEIKDLVSDNPNQTSKIKKIETAINQSQELLKLYLNTTPSPNQSPKPSVFLQNLLKKTGIQMQMTRQEIKQFIREEERLLELGRSLQNQQIQLIWISMFVVTGMGIIGSGFAIYLMQKLDQKLALQIAKTNAQERLFRDTFEQAAVGIGHISLSGQWLKVNQKFCEIVGYSREELLRFKLFDITHADDADAELYLFSKTHGSRNSKLFNRKTLSSQKWFYCLD